MLSKASGALYFVLRNIQGFHSARAAFAVLAIEYNLLTALPVLGALWLIRWLVEQKRLSLFKKPIRNWWLQLAYGFGIGTLAFLSFIGFAWLTGNYHILGIRAHYPLASLFWLVLSVAVGVFSEEILFRGYVLPTLERRWGTGIALAVSTVVFAAEHGRFDQGDVAEANVHPILHALALGALLGAAYLINRTLWLPMGLHFAWNFLGAVFFNSHTYATHAMFRYVYWAPAFDLTGIAFQSSVVICSLGAFILIRFVQRKNRWRKAGLPVDTV